MHVDIASKNICKSYMLSLWNLQEKPRRFFRDNICNFCNQKYLQWQQTFKYFHQNGVLGIIVYTVIRKELASRELPSFTTLHRHSNKYPPKLRRGIDPRSSHTQSRRLITSATAAVPKEAAKIGIFKAKVA